MSAFGPLVSVTKYTEKQKKLIDACNSVILKEGIELRIDDPNPQFVGPVALDIEHDEQGNMVCIGIYDGVKAYCFTKITPRLKELLEQI